MAQSSSIVISGADFSGNRAGLRPPSMPGLKLWCFPRTAGPTINLVTGAALTELHGAGAIPSPTYRASWVDCYGQGAGFETGVADANFGTLIAIAKAPGQSGGAGRASAPIIDNSTPSGVQFLLYNYSNEMDFYVAGLMPGGIQHIPVTGGACNNWGFYAVTWAQQIGANGYALTDGKSIAITSATNRALGSNTFKIATQPAGDAAGATSEISIAFAAIITGSGASACLTSDQLISTRLSLQLALGLDGLLF